MIDPILVHDQLTNAELAWVQSGASGVLKLLETTAPSPISGTGQLYVKSSDSNLYFKTGEGTEYQLTPVSSGLSFSDAEIPTGAINGANAIFTLAHTPSPAGSLIFMVNGQVLSPAGVDYTLVGDAVTLNTAPPTSSVVICWYRY